MPAVVRLSQLLGKTSRGSYQYGELVSLGVHTVKMVKAVFFFDFCGAFRKAILISSKLEVRRRVGSKLLILRIRTGYVPVA